MPTAKLPYLSVAPGEQTSGIACAVDVKLGGPDPRTAEIAEVAIVRFAYQRNTGKILGILEEYLGGKSSVFGLDRRAVDFLLLRSEVIFAHGSADIRPVLMRISETAGQRPWRCTQNSVDWSAMGFNGRSLDELMTAHHMEYPENSPGMERVHGLLMLLSRTDERGRRYLLQLVSGV